MDGLLGSRGLIVDPVGEESASMWATPIVCGVFGPGLTVGSVERG